MEKKLCPRCNQVKDRDCFYTRPDRKDGLQGWCKVCTKSYSSERHLSGYVPPNLRESQRKNHLYKKTKQPEKHYARQKLRGAVSRGKVSKPTECSDCGEETQLQGHHSDYSRPLEVLWLCHRCHLRIHAELKVATR